MRRIATALLCIVAQTAGATCGPAKEYAQYKDDAKDEFGRQLMASQACLYRDQEPLQRLKKDAELCATERQKILDAIKSRNDAKNLNKATYCPPS